MMFNRNIVFKFASNCGDDIRDALYDVRSGISQYCSSRLSVTDDDRLKQHVKSIPGGIILDISAVDTDSIGDPCDVHMSVEKITANSWKAKEHWFYESGANINDAMIAHDLIYLLRLRRIRICIAPATSTDASSDKM